MPCVLVVRVSSDNVLYSTSEQHKTLKVIIQDMMRRVRVHMLMRV
jgi:hypothetical protein